MTTHFEHACLMRDAGAVKRYHTVRTARIQTVAEHTFGVMQLIQQIYPDARKEVLLAAMHHDLPEYVTGDVPAPIKRQLPRLAILLEEAERGTAPLHQDFNLTAFEEAVVKWCDLMELVFWCLEEVQMGNTYAMHPCIKGLSWLWDAYDGLVAQNPLTNTARKLLRETTEAARKAGITLTVEHTKE
jgi:HD containing hydrolase-like enzyme